MNYTKGQWKREGNIISVYGRGTIAECPAARNGGVFECVNNAQLIAAAPDMFEALKDITEVLDLLSTKSCYWCGSAADKHYDNCKYIRAKNAINKAEGIC